MEKNQIIEKTQRIANETIGIAKKVWVENA